jgi:hypothetical protein
MIRPAGSIVSTSPCSIAMRVIGNNKASQPLLEIAHSDNDDRIIERPDPGDERREHHDTRSRASSDPGGQIGYRIVLDTHLQNDVRLFGLSQIHDSNSLHEFR